MEILDILPANFGYVILTYFYSWIMLTYLGLNVGRARKKYDVKVRLTSELFYHFFLKKYKYIEIYKASI